LTPLFELLFLHFDLLWGFPPKICELDDEIELSGNIGANTSKYCFTKSAIDFL
jgi:hypothetical protein